MEEKPGKEEEEEERGPLREKRKREEEQDVREAKRMETELSLLENLLKSGRSGTAILILYNLTYRSIRALCRVSKTIKKFCDEVLDDIFWRALWISDTDHIKNVTTLLSPSGKVGKYIKNYIDDAAELVYKDMLKLKISPPPEGEFDRNIEKTTTHQIQARYEAILNETFLMMELLKNFKDPTNKWGLRKRMELMMVWDGYDTVIQDDKFSLGSNKFDVQLTDLVWRDPQSGYTVGRYTGHGSYTMSNPINWWDTVAEEDNLLISTVSLRQIYGRNPLPLHSFARIHQGLIKTEYTEFTYNRSYVPRNLISVDNYQLRMITDFNGPSFKGLDLSGGPSVTPKLEMNIFRRERGSYGSETYPLGGGPPWEVASQKKLRIDLRQDFGDWDQHLAEAVGPRPAPFDKEQKVVVITPEDGEFALSMPDFRPTGEGDVSIEGLEYFQRFLKNMRILLLAVPAHTKGQRIGTARSSYDRKNYGAAEKDFLIIPKKDVVVLYDGKGMTPTHDPQAELRIYGYEENDPGVLILDKMEARVKGNELLVNLFVVGNYLRNNFGTYDPKVFQMSFDGLHLSDSDTAQFIFTPEMEFLSMINPEDRRRKHEEMMLAESPKPSRLEFLYRLGDTITTSPGETFFLCHYVSGKGVGEIEFRTQKDNSRQCFLWDHQKKFPYCHHLFYESVIQDYLTSKEPEEDLCPICYINKRPPGSKMVMINMALEDVETDQEVFDMEEELREKYGPFFLVINWQGPNQEDVNYEIYTFNNQGQYEGFLTAVNGDPEGEKRSTSFRRAYKRGKEEYDLWVESRGKFSWVIFQSAG